MVQAHESQRRKLARIAGLVLLAATVGCRSDVLRPGSLPAELTDASALPRQVDLTRLAARAAPDDSLRPGDLVDLVLVTGLEQEAAKTVPLRVGEDGAVSIPLVGKVHVAGRSLADAERMIHQESIRRGIYRRPNVALQWKQRFSHRVTVTGAVREPGVKELPVADCDLLTALMAAGGLSDDAGTIVEIRQPVGQSAGLILTDAPDATYEAATDAAGKPIGAYISDQPDEKPDEVPVGEPVETRAVGPAEPSGLVRVDLAELFETTNLRHQLLDGAVVNVKKRPPQSIHVMGLVKRANQFEVAPDAEVYLLDALAMAGGRTLEVADKVRIIRRVEGREKPVVIAVSVRRAKRGGADNVRLLPGDVISVEDTPLTFTIETLRSFIRFGFSAAIPGF